MGILVKLFIFNMFTLALVALLYLMYCLNPNIYKKRSFFYYFTRILPKQLKQMGNRLFGNQFEVKMNDLYEYIFNTNNSLIVIFYFVVSPGCYFLFVYEIMIPYFRHINKFILFMGNHNVWFGFWLYYKASTTDPGIITEENNHIYLKKYESYYDEGIYLRDQKCRTCQIVKPARSRHCSLCKVCVSKHDHHCVWIKGCVGERNYKYFVLFLLIHAFFCTIGFIITF